MLRVIKCAKELMGVDLEGFEQKRYLSRDFFSVPGVLCCLWMEDERCVSMLRLEPWQDGMLLTGLETLLSERKCGHAAALLTAVQMFLKELGYTRLYSHIDYRNGPSIRVHNKCGFRKIADTARLLDGTVTARMGTYILDVES